MDRDISRIERIIDDTKNSDIIWKKSKLMEIFKQDPDLAVELGWEDGKKKEDYIIPWLKLNGIQKTVQNYIMFDIDDTDVSYSNNIIKNQTLIIMCLVHEDDMLTPYGLEYRIPRTDLLDYLIRDLLNHSNALGMKLKLVNDFQDIIDSKFYCRTLKFKISEINTANGFREGIGVNKYDRL